MIRAAKELGLRTIAVYSELDRNAEHVQLADEAWNIGPAPAAESYLNIERMLEVAASANASAVHPGYGFLAENANFARAVIDAGLIWVGPPPEAIATMGDKITSRVAAAGRGCRSCAGNSGAVSSRRRRHRLRCRSTVTRSSSKRLTAAAARACGSSTTPTEVERAFEAARREADAYFSRPEVYVEKYLELPRHIEAQIICDTHGNAVFLGERDCSIAAAPSEADRGDPGAWVHRGTARGNRLPRLWR